jgi:hypothetical protein
MKIKLMCVIFWCFILFSYVIPALRYQSNPYGEDGTTKAEGRGNTSLFLKIQKEHLKQKRKFANSFLELEYPVLKGDKVSETENYIYHLMSPFNDNRSSSILAFPKKHEDPIYIAHIYRESETNASNSLKTILCVSNSKESIVDLIRKYSANKLIFTNKNGMLECSKAFDTISVSQSQ